MDLQTYPKVHAKIKLLLICCAQETNARGKGIQKNVFFSFNKYTHIKKNSVIYLKKKNVAKEFYVCILLFFLLQNKKLITCTDTHGFLHYLHPDG